MKSTKMICVIFLLSLIYSGCGHVQVCRIGLLSDGDLEGKTIPEKIEGPILVGKDACKMGGTPYYLSNAVRNALKGTPYDTIVNAEITTRTGVLVFSNEIEVKGTGVDSKKLPKSGGAK